ncbi:MAG: MFS transporter [Clostridiaceae bacterium]|nr:MFS transporter [Clostridiaceae bacterium]
MKHTLWTKNFTILTLGTVVSALGGAAMNIALSLVVFDNTDSTLATGVFSAVSMIPSVLLPILLAPRIDSRPRTPVIVRLDALSGAFYLLFGAYILSAGFSYTAYLLFGLLTGGIGAVYSTAYSALYPTLIPEGFLQKGYAISSIIYPTATVVMAPVAALVYTRLGIHVLYFAEGVMLLVASAFESRIRVQERVEERQKFSFRAYGSELTAGFRYLRKEKGIRSLYAYMTVTNAVSNGGNLMTMTYFQTAPLLTTAMYSLLISAETLGRMLGGLVHYAVKIPAKRRFPMAASVYFTYEAMDGILLFLPYVGMIANRFLCGFLGVNSATLRETAVQHHLPDTMRARIGSLLNVAIMAGVLLVQLLAGALGEVLPYRTVSVILAGTGFLACWLLVIRNRQSIRTLMEEEC